MLFQAFKKVAEKYSDNNALFYQNTFLTYNNVLEKVQQYSHIISVEESSLQSFLLYCNKNFHSVLWQLSCNKIGSVFINADINTPIDRIAYIVETTTPLWILTEPHIDLTNLGYLQYQNIDGAILWKSQEKYNKIPELQKKYHNQLTHIYFSSGSTGKPKAILLNDRPIISVVQQQAKLIGLTSTSKFAWLLSPSFDASLSDIYSTLLSGATLYIACFKMNQIKTLYTYFNINCITHSDLSPSVLSLIKPSSLPTLQSVIFGGEVANENVILHWRNCGIKMFNAYGPTETTICSSLKPVDHQWTSNNIGKPLLGVDYFLYPIGSQKYELLISGEHLALGYDQDILNQNKFIVIDNITYYRSGDLATQNFEGDYIFGGRVDRQFKYNGVLISPEEIENYCFQIGCIEVLCKLEDKLYLYYAGSIEPSQLKEALSQKLPSNMLPQKFIQLETLTKNINGKIQL